MVNLKSIYDKEIGTQRLCKQIQAFTNSLQYIYLKCYIGN